MLNYQHFNYFNSNVFNTVFLYSKDCHSNYLECNEATALLLGLMNTKEIAGKSDLSFGWSRERTEFIKKFDKTVIMRGRPVWQMESPFESTTGKVIQLFSYKVPIYKENKVIGISGISFNIAESSLHSNQLPLQLFMSSDHIKNVLSKAVDFNISEREHECIHHTLLGCSAKEISEKLYLSRRTIEFYLQNIKVKFNCRTKSELIKKLQIILMNNPS